MRRLADYLSLVRFGHSIFALPFALQGAWIAAGGPPSPRDLVLIVAAALCARTAAMAFNRLVDRGIDGRNPRTAARELPSGRLSAGSVRVLVGLSAAGFVALAFGLNPLSGALSLPVLGVLLGYSYVKRFSPLAHAVLGLALALAPLGAWIAVRGSLAGDLEPILWLAAAVWTWVAGFDLIYACQDADHDRAHGLHSIPARFGVARALEVSAILHVLTVVLLILFGGRAELGPAFWAVLVVASGLLVWQHRIVSPGDLSRVDVAFFALNGWVGLALFLGLALDLHLAGEVPV